MAGLPKSIKPQAEHLTDFDPPFYNVWKQQEKTPGLNHFGNTEIRFVDNLFYLYNDMIKTCFRMSRIYKKMSSMSRKKPQDMGYFLKPSGENLTGSFCSGIRGTQDRSSGLLSR